MGTKKVQIRSPIWKDRSIGINIMDCNVNDEIELDIVYTNKQGERIYPFTYIIPVDVIRVYPVQNINNQIQVHIIPIQHLRSFKTKTVIINNNNLKKGETMLFDSNTTKKVIQDSQKRKEEFAGDKRPHIPAGENILKISECEAKTSKKGDIMIVINMSKDESFRPIDKFFMVTGSSEEIGKNSLIEFLWNAFNYEIKECKDSKDEQGQEDIHKQVNDVVKQIIKLKGKPFKCAVKTKQSLYQFEDKKDNNKPKMVITEKSEYSYAGKVDDAEFYVNPNKLVLEITNEEKKKLMDFNAANVLSNDETAMPGPSLKEQGRSIGDKPVAPTTSAEIDELPF